MKKFYSILIAGLVAGWAATGRGSIEDFKQLTIDFTNAATAANAATWSTPDKLMVSKNGLGWDGEAAGVRDGWIQTKPLALGLSWRTPSAVSVRVTIQPPTREIALSNGNKTTPYAGDVYVRYSPDLKHWSSWQRLSPAEPLTPEEKKNPGRHFQATMGVSHRERQRYGELLSEYSRLDVPWTSDEEAAVRWVLGREPDFFAKQIPFIGYVEFLFEGYFYGGQRVRSFHAEVSYGMSGLHSAPKDPSTYKDRCSSPWRFEAKEKAESAVATDPDHRGWAERCLRDFESFRMIGDFFGQSQRDCVLQPRVARNELPWENHWNKSQPQRGCVRDTHGAASRSAATPLGLMDHLGSLSRVARAWQPWALRRNPFGILPARLNHHRIS